MDAKQSADEVAVTGSPGPQQAGQSSLGQSRRPGPPDLQMLHRKALAALEQSLPPDEHPRLVIPGLASSAIIATHSRAFVFKMGAKAGLPFGARLKEFEYDAVLRVDLRPSRDVDVIVIHAPLKIGSCSSYWADSRDDPWRARNAIPVTRRSDLAARSVDDLARLLSKFRRRTARRAEDKREQRRPRPIVVETETSDVVGQISALEQREQHVEASRSCPRCGSQLGDGWQFCPGCGTPALRQSGGTAQRRRRQPERG